MNRASHRIGAGLFHLHEEMHGFRRGKIVSDVSSVIAGFMPAIQGDNF